MRMNVGYEALANAVIERAVRDYVKALVVLHREPLDMLSLRTRLQVEAFFQSKRLTMFTAIPGTVLLKYARQSAKAEIDRKMKSKRRRTYSAFVG